MTPLTLASLGITDPPMFAEATDTTHRYATHAVVINAGMTSGEPSVAIAAYSPQGELVVLETSLALFLLAARGLATMAETRFGWEPKP